MAGAARIRHGARALRRRAPRDDRPRRARRALGRAKFSARTRGNVAWLSFYALFIAAVAVHAPIGLRTIIAEWLGWRGRSLDLAVALFAVLIAAAGLRTVLGLYA